MTSDPQFARYNITVHSRPKLSVDGDTDKDGPWLITLDNFISDAEADRLIELGKAE